jgi:lipopolysaccharide export LptBFGC system permease protein LptF
MHLRMPSIDKGVQSFLWAVVFFLYLFFGMKAVGVNGGTSLILALVASFLIFLFVRVRGDTGSR